jgi:ABC-type multidrug transport system ATPase subunit
MLRLVKLSRTYGHHTVLHEVDLELKEGEIVCVMGPNGAGKTSLVEAILSHNRPAGARIFFRGEEIRSIAAHNRFLSRCAYLGHEPGLMYDLTAIENLQFFADFHCKVPPKEERLLALLAAVGLEQRSRDTVRVFSRGMRQRLGLARCLLHDPDILFLDEPLTGLDPEGIERLIEILRLLRPRHASALIITHDEAPFLDIADRYLFIKAGRIVADIERNRFTDAARQHLRSL